MNDQDATIDPTEIRDLLLKALDALAAGLIDRPTAERLSKAVKRAGGLIGAPRDAAADHRRGELAAILAELRQADRTLAELLARPRDATIAAKDLNASNDE
jgi:hypothetical protein